jgi:hypothetical protein
LGVAVFAGMLGVTLFGIFLTPVFFRAVQWVGWTDPPPAGGRPAPAEKQAPPDGHGGASANGRPHEPARPAAG